MTNLQQDWLTMYLQVKAVFEKYSNVWNGNVRLSADISVFLLNLTGIETQRDLQTVNQTGIGQLKQICKADLIEHTMLAATAVKTFSIDTSNPELAANVKYVPSQLKKMREIKLLAVCQVIFDKAAGQVALLSDYGVNPDTQVEFQNTMEQFKVLHPRPMTALRSTKAVTQSLASLCKDTNGLLQDKVDGKMLQFKRTSPAFYTDYTNARPVIHRGKRTKKVTQPELVQPQQA